MESTSLAENDVLIIGFRLPEFRRVASTAIGLVLVSASLFKARQWYLDPFAVSDVPAIPILRAAVIDFELILGFWLISGLLPRAAWTLAIATFSVFLAITSRDAIIGKASCSCFGSFATSPWLVGVFDLAAIVLLVTLFPKALPRSRTAIIFAVMLLPATVIPASIALLRVVYPHLQATPELLDLGVAAPGSTSRAAFFLHNDGDVPLDVVSVKTSCHCLTVYLPRQAIPAGQWIECEIVVAHETGAPAASLSMNAGGYDSGGRELFALTVLVTVSPMKIVSVRAKSVVNGLPANATDHR